MSYVINTRNLPIAGRKAMMQL